MVFNPLYNKILANRMQMPIILLNAYMWKLKFLNKIYEASTGQM